MRKRGIMKVSAVGFLFQKNIKSDGLKGKNYTCIIHKVNPDGSFNRSRISSPLIKESRVEVISPSMARSDIMRNLFTISAKDSNSKFIGATIKDGVKETEIHSIFSDKLFAVRTRDEFGKDKLRLLGKNSTKELLKHNLYLNV